MRWTRTLQTVDVHCAGEIGRVITGGVLDIPGATMGDKLTHLNTVDDSLRRFLCSEPRSAPAGSFVLLTPSTHSGAACGMIVLQPDQAHAMSGSNAMCAVTALLETGMVPITGPETVVTLDTAAGPVRAVATCDGGKVTRVTLDMPPAFVLRRGGVVETPEWGPVAYDISFGGVFYALIDISQPAFTRAGLTITPDNARALAMAGVALRNRITAQETVAHPDFPGLTDVAYAMFYSRETDGAIRTCTTLRPGRADRSPCGTGSNATMALRHAAGEVAPGEMVVSRSIIGGEFTTTLAETTTVGPHPATRNRVSGQCWIYGISQIGLDPTDPFPSGFTLSDTWGG